MATIIENHLSTAIDIIPVKISSQSEKRSLTDNNAHAAYKRDISKQYLSDDALGKIKLVLHSPCFPLKFLILNIF